MMSKSKKRQWGKWEAQGQSFDQGGQGQIYRVTDTTGEKIGTYILKELKNPKRIDRFENEIQAIGSLSTHQNVVQLIDSGIYRDREKPAYVMPEADMALDKYLSTRNFSVDELLDIFIGILSGIEHIHKEKIIHRDIKPENILVFSGVPKISDLGLCLIADAPRHTHIDEAVGPRYYMAPELEDGRHPDVSYSADIYSLGKLMYFILSKDRKIFAREKFQDGEWALHKQHVDDRFSMFTEIFQMSIALRPLERFKSVAIFIEAVKKVKNKFLNHPATTLRKKVPGIEIDLSGPSNLLLLISPEEWSQLLVEREKANAPYSETLFNSLKISLNDVVAHHAANELLRNENFISLPEKSRFASEIILSFKENINLHQLGSQKSRIYFLAIQSGDVDAIRAIAAELMPADNEILMSLVRHMGIFNSNEVERIIFCAMLHPFDRKEDILLNFFDPDHLSVDALGMYVAGLANVGSPECIERIANILRSKPMDECPELIQGLGLSKNETIFSALITMGKFDERTLRFLELMEQATLSVLSKKEKSSEEEMNEDEE